MLKPGVEVERKKRKHKEEITIRERKGPEHLYNRGMCSATKNTGFSNGIVGRATLSGRSEF